MGAFKAVLKGAFEHSPEHLYFYPLGGHTDNPLPRHAADREKEPVIPESFYCRYKSVDREKENPLAVASPSCNTCWPITCRVSVWSK